MGKISPLMILPPLVFLAFVVMAGLGMWRDDPDALPSTREGQIVPPVALTKMAGKDTFDNDTLRDGEVKLVNFWASWCAPCRVEHPNLVALRAEGVAIYGINYKDDPSNALGFLEDLGDPFTALGADDTGRTALEWGVYGVPETYVIAGDGTIVLRWAGPLTTRVIEETLRPALAQAAAR